MKQKQLVVLWLGLLLSGVLVSLGAEESSLQAAMENYNQAFRNKDVETVRSLLAPEVLLYEHSVRNDGREDVFENHLKPEILEFQNLQLDFSDVRITPGAELSLVTRQYRVRGKLGERVIDAMGNETMVWRMVGGQWKIVHIHYSHACPRPPAPSR